MRLCIGLRTPRRASSLLVATAAALSLGAQCAGDPSVTCEVELPSALSGPAQWLEVGALPGACPASSELAGGLPVTGLVARVAFAKGNMSPPPIGSLKKGAYAFAAVARAADCGVLATGCSQVDVTDARDISIALAATSARAGACGAAQDCVDARCVPTLGGADAAVAGCTMTFVSAGPLGDPLQAATDIVSRPAAVATASGFLVAYREYDPGGGAARLRVVSIDAGGGLRLATPTLLPMQCPGQDETDAVGMGFTAGAGVVISARPACGAEPPGLDALNVDATGAASMSVFTPESSGKPVLSGGAVSLTGASTGWLAYLALGKANVVALSGLRPQGAPVVFDPAASRTLAAVAASGQGVALLAGGAATGGDASGTEPNLELALGPSLAALAANVDFPGTWGAVALAGTRALVLSDSTVSTQPLALHAVDPPPAGPASATFAPGRSPSGPATGGDLAVRADLAFVAAEEQNAVSLDVFDHASTTPTLLRAVALSDDARVPSQAGLRDGKVAVAASATQVLVAWVRGTSLGANEPVGGWALYACGP